jgi:SAM-dependent methyltransferase
VDYSALVPGAIFDLVEGSKVVATGRVLPPDQATAQFYESYVEQDAIRAEAPHSAISRYFDLAFKAGDKVLDIGSGSGRDLAVLIGKGVDAYGIEPNDAMRTFALKKHPQLADRVRPGSLPMIGMPFGGNFDGVVCSAVLMPIPEEQFLKSWESIRQVLKPNGKVLFSLPAMRPDLLMGDRDEEGRFFRNHSPGLVGAVLASLGFSRVDLGAQAISAFPDVTWSIYLFE